MQNLCKRMVWQKDAVVQGDQEKLDEGNIPRERNKKVGKGRKKTAAKQINLVGDKRSTKRWGRTETGSEEAKDGGRKSTALKVRLREEKGTESQPKNQCQEF